jgi:hypothetical protein
MTFYLNVTLKKYPETLRKQKVFVGVLKVKDENSRIRSRIWIHWSEARIRSVPKCEGSTILVHCHMRRIGDKNTLRHKREWDFVGSGPVLPATPPDAGTPWEGVGPSQADDGEEGGGAHQKSGEDDVGTHENQVRKA